MNTPNKNQLRRLSAIVHVMNCGKWMNLNQIQNKVNLNMQDHFSRSTIEKDLFNLKMNYDFEYESKKGYGIRLENEVDFLELLKIHLNLF
jgi:hypothetical protein